MKRLITGGVCAGAALLALAGCEQETTTSPTAAPVEATAEEAIAVKQETPAASAADADAVAAQLAETSKGKYDIEKTHAFLIWKVSHGGLSTYVAKFTDWDATIDFDPANPAASTVTASINPMSVQTDHPTKAAEWHKEISEDFLKAGEFPAITFNSTNVEVAGPNTGNVTGDLTFLGVTKPITLAVTYNGVGNKPWFGERDIIGFDAKTKFKRSDFGLTQMIDNGIGDEVSIWMTGEFLQQETESPASE